MTTNLTGSEVAGRIRADVTAAAAQLTAAGTTPHLAVVLATADESTAWYVRSSLPSPNTARKSWAIGPRCRTPSGSSL